jgi:hypothetical protein
MVSIPKASRGKTVYSQGSFAPTRGRVSSQGVQGYIDREQRKPASVSRVGRDGQSDTRSGVAAKALKKHMFDNGGRQISTAPVQAPVLPTSGVYNVTSGFPSTPGSADYASPNPSTPTLPTSLVANASGQLELPYSDAWNSELLDALNESNASLADLSIQSQNQALEYAKTKRNLGIGYTDTKRSSLNNAAGAGTAFSSGYGLRVGRDAQENLNANNDLDAANTAFANQINLQRSQITNAFNSRLQQAVSEYAAQLAAEQAGSLGYGNDSSTAGGASGGPGATDPAHYAYQDVFSHGSKGGKGKNKPTQLVANAPGKKPYENKGRPLTPAQKAIKKGKK